MADITLDKVSKRFPDGFEAVKQMDLDIKDGEFMILVGPSGCGKSTALRMIAGLEDISDGSLKIGGEVVNDRAPKDRDIAMVFQNYALYPHMTVRQKMEFPFGSPTSLTTRSARRSRRRRRSSISTSISTASPRTCPVASASAWRWGARSSATRARS